MILLDTNVVSESLRPKPDGTVLGWLDAQELGTLYLSAVSVAELRAGVAVLPAGKRKSVLREGLEERILPLFTGRILPFDYECTSAYAELTESARSSGVAVAVADGLIAAVAKTNHMAVATRDTTPFAAAGVSVINPWSI